VTVIESDKMKGDAYNNWGNLWKTYDDSVDADQTL
jgi:hypothetical protein